MLLNSGDSNQSNVGLPEPSEVEDSLSVKVGVDNSNLYVKIIFSNSFKSCKIICDLTSGARLFGFPSISPSS